MYELKVDVELLNSPLEIDVKFDQVEVISADLANINAALDSLNGASITGQTLAKIAYLETEAKQAIKDSIEDYGVIVDDTTFDDYHTYVDMIGAAVSQPIKEQLDIVHGQELADLSSSIALLGQIKSDLITSIEAKGSDVPDSPIFANFSGYIDAIEQIDIVPIDLALDELNGEVILDDTLDKIENANDAKIDMLNALDSLGVDTGAEFDFPTLGQINTSLDLVNEEVVDGIAFDKIDYINGWKADIKAAITDAGVDTSGSLPVDYADDIALIPAATEAAIKADLDAANEEISADVDAAVALVDSNYAAIKTSLENKSIDMTGIKPSGYDDAIASIVIASGDAVAGDLLADKTATTAAGAITGTRPLTAVAKTGQTSTTVANDDGALQRGVASPTPRFVDNADNTVTDNLTGLMWTKSYQLSGAVAWGLALAAIANLNTTSYAGYTDWRPANIRELQTLIDYQIKFPAPHPFSPDPTNALVKSNTDAIGDNTRALYVSFSNAGVAAGLKTSATYVWACRGGL